MDDLLKLQTLGKELGHSGTDLSNFITEQQKIARDEREKEREERSKEKEREERSKEKEREEREKERAHEIRLAELRGGNDATPVVESLNQALIRKDMPRQAPFSDGDLVSYLIRFERLAQLRGWTKERDYALQLGYLLSGRALSVYSSLSSDITENYDRLKDALLFAFGHTENQHRLKFRNARISNDESYHSFSINLGRLFDYWIQSAKIDQNYDNLRELMLKDQFLSSCPSELRTFIKEHDCQKVEDMARFADVYCEAHNKKFSSKTFSKTTSEKETTSNDSKLKGYSGSKDKIKCFSCGMEGHRARECPQNPKLTNPLPKNKVNFAFNDKIRPGELVCGTVNGASVSTILRDTGCSCFIVSDNLIPESTDVIRTCVLSDYLGRQNTFPVVKCHITSPFFSGWAEVVRAPIQFCSVLIGNDPSNFAKTVRSFEHNDPNFGTDHVPEPSTENSNVNAVTRSQNLNECSSLNCTSAELIRLQNSCATLEKVRTMADRGGTETTKAGLKYKYSRYNNLLYRVCTKSPRTRDVGQRVLVVPAKLRNAVLNLAHNNPLSGHFSYRKTQNKIFETFYWPKAGGDIKRYCMSCDICQRTSQRGRLRPVELQTMPVITTPFSRISMDIVGPISPASSDGHKYILTVLDMATRFPEAIPLKNIDTISVAEALVEIFSRVGIPRECLTDRGKQFTSDLMSEIDKLLSIKPLFTTPYHPMGNGACEKMNGTLKSVLRKICADHPKEWHKYLPCALFACREIPHDSLGFSPFELLYGRRVRGPLSVLSDLWENPQLNEETRNSYLYVLELRNRLEETAQIAADNLKTSAALYKSYFDVKSQKRSFKVGDEVLLLLPTDKNKLIMKWKGPFKILERYGPADYLIDMKTRQQIFHANMLKRYFRRTTVQNLNVIDDVSTVEMVLDGGSRFQIVQASVVESTDDSIVTLPVSDHENVNINPDLDESKTADLIQILKENADVISSIPGTTNTLEHKIDVTCSEPIRKKAYPVPESLKEVFVAEVDKMLDLGIIEPSCSPYSSPPVLVKKSNSEYRMCIDFRAINSITKFDAEPMPTIEGDLPKFVGSKFISEIDMCKAYHQVPLEENSKKYTAFPTPYGLMQFTKLPFGLSTACSTYIRLMRRVFKDCANVSCYFDNVYVFTETWEDHLNALRNVFDRLRVHGLTAGPSKCFVGYEKITYLGLELGNDTITPLSDKIKAVTDMPLPSNKKELRSFVGTVSFYRKFIPNLADLMAPVLKYLKKGSPDKFSLGHDEIRIFEKLKLSLTSKPILQLPDHSKTYVVRTDASDKAIGSVLLQYHDNVPLPVMYASRKLTKCELNYATIEKECLALVWAISRFHQYVFGREFVLETDHQPLTYLRTMKPSNGRLMRWALTLQSYNFRVIYIKGSENIGADLLSRLSA